MSNKTARSTGPEGATPLDPPAGSRPRSFVTRPWPWWQARRLGTAVGAHRGWSSAEVPCLGVVRDQRVGGLLGDELELLRQHYPDPLRAQQPDQLCPVVQVRAGRVAERVAAAAVADLEDAIQLGRVELGQAKLLAHTAVPVLRQGLGELNRQPVQLQVVPVGVLGEQLRGRSAELRPDGDQLEADHVWL